MLLTKDRIKELTTTSGTGTLTLSGTAEQGFQAFSVLGNGTKCYYTITDVNGTDFEVGLGTYSSNTLTRDTILESSNSGNAISLSATGSTVFVTYPAEKSSYRDIGVNRDYTASGSITAGKPLILNADNTVSEVKTVTTTTSVTYSAGSETEVQAGSGNIQYANITYDINEGKYLAIYKDEGDGYGYANVLSTSGTTLSVGSKSSNFSGSANMNIIDSVYDEESGNHVIFYYNGVNQYGYAVVASISGTSVTFGTPVAFNSANTYYRGTCFYDSTNKKVVWVGGEFNGSAYTLKAIIGTVSGTSISFGTISDSGVTSSNYYSSAYDKNSSVGVVSYRDSSAHGNIRTISISGTSITWNTAIVFQASNTTMSADSMTYDETNQKIVLFFKDSSDNVQGIVGTVSGTTISMGTAVDSTYNNGSNTFACVWTKQGVVALINRDDSSPYYLHYLQATVSGTSLSYAGATTLNSQAVSVDATGVSIAYNSATYNVVPFYVENATKDAQALVVYPSGTVTTTTKNLTNDNYFGIASTTASDTEAVGVNRAGSFNNDQTGLTAGKDYYAKDDGTIIERTTTSTTGAVTEAYSSETALNDPSEKTVVVSDGNGTFLMVYQGSSLYTTIQAGTMSGTTMTWGTAQVFESTDTNGTAVWWDSNRSCFVVCARSTTGNTYVRVKTITVSGQAITIVDSEQTQVFGGSYDQSTMRGGYDSTAQVGFFVNTRGNSPTKTSIIVVSLDGSKQITFGTEVQDNDRIYYPSQFVHDTNGNGNVAVIGARYNSSTTAEVNTQQAYVITISGTTPTIKTPVEIATYTYKYGYSVYDASANKTVCIYGDGSKVYYNVCSMSSGVITSGTETEIATGNITEATQEFAYAGSYDPFTEQIGITYHDSSNYYYLRSGKVSGASITWSTAIQVDPSTVNKHVNVVNANSSDSNTLVLYWVNSDSAYNTWTIGSSGVTSLTVNASQFVGTARSSTDLELAEPPIELVGLSNGAITKGRPVILRTDGDFEEVALSSITNTYTYSKGTETELSVDAGTTVNSVYDANADRFVVTHQNSSFGYAIVVSTSGTTPTVENAVSFCSGQYNGEHAIPVYDSTNNRVAIIYTKGNDNNKGASVVGNVGASTISFGSEVEYNSDTNGGSGGRWAYFDEENGKVVLFVRQFTNNNYPTVYIGTINDTAITWTGGTVIESTAMTGGIGASYSSASKKGLFAWEDNSNTGQAIVGTLSDTTMTFGTKAQFTSQNIQTSWTYTTNGICYDSVADKFIILYQIMTGVDGQGIVATISGTDVSFGTETKLHEEWNNVNTIRQSDLGKIPIIYRDSLNNPYYAEITITGTTPSKSGDARLNSNTTYFTGLSIDTSVGDVKLLATYEDNVNDLASTVIVPNGSVTNENPNLTATNFIGFAQKTVADNEDVKVATTGQSDENQSSLTTASQYYVQNDGTLSTTAGTPSVLGGTALSSTKILIKS